MVQGLPKRTKKESKVGPRREKEVESHLKETNRPQNIYTKTKYMQTPDPPPYSGRLVIIIRITNNTNNHIINDNNRLLAVVNISCHFFLNALSSFVVFLSSLLGLFLVRDSWGFVEYVATFV